MVSELIAGVLIAGVFFVGALIIQIIGTNFADKRNHKQKIKYMKEETFFKKKTEFFERITKEIEKKLKAYSELKVLILIKNDKAEKKIMDIFKDLRDLEEMHPRGISLYYKNAKITLGLTEFIVKGVNVKLMLPHLNKQLKEDKIEKDFIKDLDVKINEVLKIGEKLIFTLKEDLER